MVKRVQCNHVKVPKTNIDSLQIGYHYLNDY